MGTEIISLIIQSPEKVMDEEAEGKRSSWGWSPTSSPVSLSWAGQQSFWDHFRTTVVTKSIGKFTSKMFAGNLMKSFGGLG